MSARWAQAAMAGALAGLSWFCGGAWGGDGPSGLTPDRVMILYNSQNADSLAVRNLYRAAHPGVTLELDLNDANVQPGTSFTRNNYLNRVRAPLLAYLAGTDGAGVPLSQRVICIVTTRGLPARINGTAEFDAASSWASLESELTLAHQDLEAPGASNLPFRYSGIVDNPYHALSAPIDGYSRASITTARPFQYFAQGAWRINGLTPGDLYLVVRLDAAPSAGATAVENVAALLQRSAAPAVDVCGVQVLLDEYGCADQLDDDGFTSLFPGADDFGLTRQTLESAGFSVTHDQTTAWVSFADLPDGRPLAVFGTYGENHDLQGCGDDPPGDGSYVWDYLYAPGAMFVSYESFNGASIHDGQPRQGQAQVLDFIAAGGTFTIGHVREPFTFAIPDVQHLSRNLLVNGMTFAEAAYSATPGLSWQTTPIGDPLARVVVLQGNLDVDGDGDLDADDLYAFELSPLDVDCDGDVDGDDRAALQNAVRSGEVEDVTAARLP
ncbi:MAG: hypothetical protein IBJ10_04125 [Phycisphaerales bacterium]|nr:hypothetical protein [Phycisphaerales bacterium]